MNYRNSEAEAQEVVAQIVAKGRRAVAIRGDVGKRGDVVAMFAAVEKRIRATGYSSEQCRDVFLGEIRGID